jgi:hypothetical protein
MVCWTILSVEACEPSSIQSRECVHDPSHVISYEPLDIQANLTYEELPVQDLNRKKHQLRTKTISLVNILWQNHGVE